MAVIVLDRAGVKAKCSCCGQAATTNVCFKGPGADKHSNMDLCPGCKSLLGQMLVEVESTATH